MKQRMPFWNIYIAISMVAVAALVGVFALNGARDDGVIWALLGFVLVLAGTISRIITNKTLNKWRWKNYTTFERWSIGIGATMFLSIFLVDMFIRHGK